MPTQCMIGNFGDDVRSDCRVTLEIRESGGREIVIASKVKALFGKSIRKLSEDILDFYKIESAYLKIEDTGALDYVIAARIEAAIRMITGSKEEYLLPALPQNTNFTRKDQFRRARLYLPGNTPKLAINAGIHQPDGIILDLEDSVAPPKKYEARFVVRNSLRNVDFYGGERMVRINQLPLGLEDLEMVVPHGVNLILLPKCEEAKQVQDVVKKIHELLPNDKAKAESIWIMPIIESTKGVLNAYQIASSSPQVSSLAIGLEDYTADLGTQRTEEGKETYFARCMLVNAARAAGIQAIDSVYSDVANMDGLHEFATFGKSLGFEGMGCIHPRQIAVINQSYAPEEKEIEKAKKIVKAFIEAEEKGLGVVSLGSKMIDPPVVKRAQNTITLAIKSGLLAEDWREHE